MGVQRDIEGYIGMHRDVHGCSELRIYVLCSFHAWGSEGLVFSFVFGV